MTYTEQADRVLAAQLRLDETRHRNADCTLCGKHIGWRSGLRAAGAAVGIGSAYTRRIGWCWPCWHRIVDRPQLTKEECDEIGLIVADCPECRAARHLPSRDHAPRAEYYCMNCRYEWSPGGPDRDWPMIISGLATIAIIIAVVLGCMLEAAAYAIGHNWSQDGIMGATLLGAPLGIVAVLVLSGVFHLLNNIAYAVYEYVWGPPLSWFDTVPRRPRA